MSDREVNVCKSVITLICRVVSARLRGMNVSFLHN